MTGIQLITRELIAEVTDKATGSPRRRMNFNFHAGPEDNPHRMLNILLRGTYVPPHRHLNPDKSEAFLVLEGAAKVVCFDDAGQPTAVHRLTAPTESPVWGIDLAAGIWHTILAESDVAVCYEVKPGPWQPSSDKDFATWAPKENQPGWREYLTYLEGL